MRDVTHACWRSVVDEIGLDEQLPNACLEDRLGDELIDADQAGDVLYFLGVVRGEHADVRLYGLDPCLFASSL